MVLELHLHEPPLLGGVELRYLLVVAPVRGDLVACVDDGRYAGGECQQGVAGCAPGGSHAVPVEESEQPWHTDLGAELTT